MKKYVFLMMMAATTTAVAGFNKNADNLPDVYETNDAPPYAASKKVWKFGDLIWSDAIQMPDCDEEYFELSLSTPECRSYYVGDTKWFYYNWYYLSVYRENVCPDPWRLPKQADGLALCDATTPAFLTKEWGLSGDMDGGPQLQNLLGLLWTLSATPRSADNEAWPIVWDPLDRSLCEWFDALYKGVGLPVRCVR
jgi:hypothetical protein